MEGMRIDPNELEPLEAYKLGTSVIVPRPIAWVGSRSDEGVDNLAPFSYFMGVSTRPPSLAISVARGRKGMLKDTANNILQTGVFTVSTVSHAMVDAMVDTSRPWAADESEFERSDVAAMDADLIDAPRPADALVCMECTLVHVHDMQSTHLFVGEVLRYHLRDDAVQVDDKGHRIVDIRALEPVGRLGSYDYCVVRDTFARKPQK